MGRFFSVEGKFYTVCSKIVDMVILTLMWAVGCIPIVTILTSTSSMYHTTVKCIRYERGKVWEEFMDAYKKNLKQGVGLTVLFGVIGAAIGYGDYYVFAVAEGRSYPSYLLAMAMLVLSVLYLLNVIWLVPVFSRFSDTFGRILRLNYVIAVRNLLRSIPMFLIFLAAVILTFASVLLIIISPSLVLLLHSYLAEPAMRKFMPKVEDDNGDWRYGFR